MSADIVLSSDTISLASLRALWSGGQSIDIDAESRRRIAESVDAIQAKIDAGERIYGVNTGYGALSSVTVDESQMQALQENVAVACAAGTGPSLADTTVRLSIVLKLNNLVRGHSGVRQEIVDALIRMVNEDALPVVPAQGSVGASGDLAPLAHMAAVMIGAGEATYEGKTLPGGEALAKAGLTPVVLGPKEGLALINGTQFSTACALVGLFSAWRNAASSIVTASLSTDAIMGSTAPLVDEIHTLRGHPGQINVARAMRDLMTGSEIRESHREGDTRVQDPYCIRCQPQVTGAAMDLLRFAGQTLEIEANAVTDNPLVLKEDGRIVSGGNFHAEPVAFAADQIALAVAEIGAIAQRRVALMVDPTLSHDLPPFLTPEPGLNSGLMIAEVTTAALMSENKHLANPCSTDSTPTSANQEDHVSMAAHGARRLARMNANLSNILGVELICAAQGVEFRAPLKTSPGLLNVLKSVRADIPTVKEDRYMAPDLAKAAELVSQGTLVAAAKLSGFVVGEDA